MVADAELKTTQAGKSVTSFAIAVERSYGEKKQTDYIDIVAWEKTAEFIAKWFGKGKMIAISGRLQTRNWESKSGEKHKSTEIVASEVNFCGDKKTESAAPTDFEEIAPEDTDLPF